MSTVLGFLGIHNDDIERSAELVEDVFAELEIDINGIDDMYGEFEENIKTSFSWDYPTDSIIECLFDTASSYIERNTGRKVEYYVNGYCSEFELLPKDREAEA